MTGVFDVLGVLIGLVIFGAMEARADSQAAKQIRTTRPVLLDPPSIEMARCTVNPIMTVAFSEEGM